MIYMSKQTKDAIKVIEEIRVKLQKEKPLNLKVKMRIEAYLNIVENVCKGHRLGNDAVTHLGHAMLCTDVLRKHYLETGTNIANYFITTVQEKAKKKYPGISIPTINTVKYDTKPLFSDYISLQGIPLSLQTELVFSTSVKEGTEMYMEKEDLLTYTKSQVKEIYRSMVPMKEISSKLYNASKQHRIFKFASSIHATANNDTFDYLITSLEDDPDSVELLAALRAHKSAEDLFKYFKERIDAVPAPTSFRDRNDIYLIEYIKLIEAIINTEPSLDLLLGNGRYTKKQGYQEMYRKLALSRLEEYGYINGIPTAIAVKLMVAGVTDKNYANFNAEEDDSVSKTLYGVKSEYDAYTGSFNSIISRCFNQKDINQAFKITKKERQKIYKSLGYNSKPIEEILLKAVIDKDDNPGITQLSYNELRFLKEITTDETLTSAKNKDVARAIIARVAGNEKDKLILKKIGKATKFSNDELIHMANMGEDRITKLCAIKELKLNQKAIINSKTKILRDILKRVKVEDGYRCVYTQLTHTELIVAAKLINKVSFDQLGIDGDLPKTYTIYEDLKELNKDITAIENIKKCTHKEYGSEPNKEDLNHVYTMTKEERFSMYEILEITSEESNLIEERLLKAVIDKLWYYGHNQSFDTRELSPDEFSFLKESTPDEIHSICERSEYAKAIIDKLLPPQDNFPVVAQSSSEGAQDAVGSIREKASEKSGTKQNPSANQDPDIGVHL